MVVLSIISIIATLVTIFGMGYFTSIVFRDPNGEIRSFDLEQNGFFVMNLCKLLTILLCLYISLRIIKTFKPIIKEIRNTQAESN